VTANAPSQVCMGSLMHSFRRADSLLITWPIRAKLCPPAAVQPASETLDVNVGAAGLTLVAAHAQVTNTAPIVGASISDHTRYVVPFLPLWPSVTFEPGATVSSSISHAAACLLHI
jgi:hypothetical protein